MHRFETETRPVRISCLVARSVHHMNDARGDDSVDACEQVNQTYLFWVFYPSRGAPRSQVPDRPQRDHWLLHPMFPLFHELNVIWCQRYGRIRIVALVFERWHVSGKISHVFDEAIHGRGVDHFRDELFHGRQIDIEIHKTST